MGSKYAMVLDRCLYHMSRQNWFNFLFSLWVNKRKCTVSWHYFALTFLVEFNRSLRLWTVLHLTCWKCAGRTVCRDHVSGYICPLLRRCSPKNPFNTIALIHERVGHCYLYSLTPLYCQGETEHNQLQCSMHSLQYCRFRKRGEPHIISGEELGFHVYALSLPCLGWFRHVFHHPQKWSLYMPLLQLHPRMRQGRREFVVLQLCWERSHVHVCATDVNFFQALKFSFPRLPFVTELFR